MSRIVRPDPRRTIHLDGVGDVRRPIEVGHDASGLTHLSMRAYDFLEGQVIDGEAEGDEVAIVLLSGRAVLRVMADGIDETYELTGRKDPFEAPAHAVYLPPHYRYQLRLERDSTVSYSRSEANGERAPFHATPESGNVETLHGGVLRRVLFGEDAAEHITCEEWILPAGSWHPMPGLRVEDPSGTRVDVLLHVLLSDPDAHVLATTADDERPWLLRHRDTLAVSGCAFGLAVPPSTDAAVLYLAAGSGPARTTTVAEPSVYGA